MKKRVIFKYQSVCSLVVKLAFSPLFFNPFHILLLFFFFVVAWLVLYYYSAGSIFTLLCEAHTGGSQTPEAAVSVTCIHTERERGTAWWDTFNQSSRRRCPGHAFPPALTWPAGVNPVRPGWTWQAVAAGQEDTEFTGTVSPLWLSGPVNEAGYKRHRKKSLEIQ